MLLLAQTVYEKAKITLVSWLWIRSAQIIGDRETVKAFPPPLFTRCTSLFWCVNEWWGLLKKKCLFLGGNVRKKCTEEISKLTWRAKDVNTECPCVTHKPLSLSSALNKCFEGTLSAKIPPLLLPRFICNYECVCDTSIHTGFDAERMKLWSR